MLCTTKNVDNYTCGHFTFTFTRIFIINSCQLLTNNYTITNTEVCNTDVWKSKMSCFFQKKIGFSHRVLFIVIGMTLYLNPLTHRLWLRVSTNFRPWHGNEKFCSATIEHFECVFFFQPITLNIFHRKCVRFNVIPENIFENVVLKLQRTKFERVGLQTRLRLLLIVSYTNHKVIFYCYPVMDFKI